MLQADLSMKQVRDIIAMVSDKVHSKPQSALMVMHSRSQTTRFLSSGIDKFNVALKGGLLIGSISEICGAPGAGKTQFCLNCTLQAVTSSSGAGVIYIDTELKFDPNRLIQMAIECHPELYSSEFRTDAPHQIDNLLNSVKVAYATVYLCTCPS
jgi:RAD51-like protein 1